MRWDAKANKLEIDNANCVHCMHCINVMPKALKPGKERGATILVACSGGPDSLALLSVLTELARTLRLKLVVAALGSEITTVGLSNRPRSTGYGH